MKDRGCGNCLFWSSGQCRRYPPAFFHALSGEYRFPVTPEDGWCGEHKGKPGRKANGNGK